MLDPCPPARVFYGLFLKIGFLLNLSARCQKNKQHQEDIYRSWDLSREQIAKIEGLKQSFRNFREAIESEPSLLENEKKEKSKNLREQLLQKTLGLLSEEQRIKFDIQSHANNKYRFARISP